MQMVVVGLVQAVVVWVVLNFVATQVVVVHTDSATMPPAMKVACSKGSQSHWPLTSIAN